MYRIIGADKKEYGPVSIEHLKQWIAEGRVNGQTIVKPENAENWVPLASVPELAALLSLSPAPPELSSAAGPAAPTPVIEGDYDLDVGGCVGNAWRLYQANFGLLFGGVAIFLLVQAGISLLAQIPILGILISLASIIIGGPLTAGVYFFILKVIRRQPAEVGDVFSGFKYSFGQTLLGYLVVALLAAISALPGILICVYPGIMIARNHHAAPLHILLIVFGVILAIIPAIYLGVSWLFTLPLIIDKRLDFWTAMSVSRRSVGRHWWSVFGLSIINGLIMLGGLLLCCVGVFFAAPLSFASFMYAYETIFNARPTTTAAA